MRKLKLNKLWFALLLFGISSMALTANRYEEWQGSAVIQTNGNLKYKSCFLNGQVYRYGAPDLRDLRLVDVKGEIVPYFIERGFLTAEKSEFEYQTNLIKVFRKKRDSYFDFKVIQPKKLVDTPGNRLVVTLPEQDFYKEIEIYGSYDGDSWEYLGCEPFYRVNELKKDSFIMAKTEKYSFYRLKVVNNADAIALLGLLLFDSRLKQEWEQFQRKAALTYKNEVKGQWSKITIENPNRLPICQIHLETNGNYKRNYQLVESKQDEWLQSGVLYRVRFEGNNITATDIGFPDPVRERRLVLKIDNQDNRPIEITQIEAVYAIDKIIFEATGSKEYRLVFGNPAAKRPQYDLEYYQEQLLKEEQDLLQLSKVTIKSKGLSTNQEILRKYFNIVVILAAFVLMFLLWLKLKGNSGEKGSEDR